jgi:hypothetical protein
LPKVEGVPRYKDFNTIRKNNHVKDDDVLRYVPYFGETDDIDLTEAYKVEVRTAEEEEDLERTFHVNRRLTIGSKILTRIVERYLEINSVTVEQASKILLDEPVKKLQASPLEAKVQRLAEEWEDKTEISLEFVIESYDLKKPSK